jgi:hypothetical protein
MAEHNSSLAAGYKCFGNLPFGASQEKEKKKKKLPSSRSLNFTSQGQGDACLFEKDAGVYSKSNSPVFTIVHDSNVSCMKVDARTPQAFLIFMCLCIFRFIICPQAKVAASCPCPADVGRGVRSLSAFTYRAICCVLNSLGAAQMVLLFFFKEMALSFCRLFVFFSFLHGHQAHTGVSVYCVYSHV